MLKLSLLAVVLASLMLSGCASQKLANSDELQSKALADAANVDAMSEELIHRLIRMLKQNLGRIKNTHKPLNEVFRNGF